MDTDMDTDFWRGSSDADPNRQKMGQSQQWVKEGGFESGGVDYIEKFRIIDFFLQKVIISANT